MTGVILTWVYKVAPCKRGGQEAQVSDQGLCVLCCAVEDGLSICMDGILCRKLPLQLLRKSSKRGGGSVPGENTSKQDSVQPRGIPPHDIVPRGIGLVYIWHRTQWVQPTSHLPPFPNSALPLPPPS